MFSVYLEESSYFSAFSRRRRPYLQPCLAFEDVRDLEIDGYFGLDSYSFFDFRDGAYGNRIAEEGCKDGGDGKDVRHFTEICPYC